MTALRDIGEGGLLKLILPHLSMRGGDLLVGPGEDDAAAWSDPPGGTTVATVDAFVEGVHFDRRWLRVEEIGWRALALTLGDLACKGARPTYGLVSVSVPDSWTAEDVVGLYMGMSGLAGDVGLRLAGGDTTSAPRHACLAVTVLGRPAGAVVPRSAARPGWSVAVTGRLGAAAAGLAAVTSGRACPPAWESVLRRPRPRLKEGAVLARHGLCSGDVSDGLVREMEKVAAASGAGCRIRIDRVPAAEGVPPELAVASGEEMELVCAGPEEAIRAAAAELACELTVVGRLTPEPDVVAVDGAGRAVPLSSSGHEHFR